MKIKRVLKPGQPGSKRLAELYGDNLVCIRYRYDEENRRAFKTIELIIENLPWQPRIPKNKIMNIKVDWDENSLRNRVKAAGGKWHAEQKVWRLPYAAIVNLGLTARIVE